MALGQQQSFTQLNNLLVQLVTQMDNWAAVVAQLQDYVVAAGAAGLENLPNPFTAEDAAAYASAVSYLNTISLVWTGQAAQPSEYNFSGQLHDFIGPVAPAL